MYEVADEFHSNRLVEPMDSSFGNMLDVDTNHLRWRLKSSFPSNLLSLLRQNRQDMMSLMNDMLLWIRAVE